jgi:ATP-binding cassette subfamily C protein CydC
MSVLREVVWPSGAARRWLVLAALLGVAAALAGMVLLALSGWLITATGLAGLGMWAMLDIFAPGAGIRAAAVARTVARYLERLLGHDATFRQLARLREAAAAGLLRLPIRQLRAMRSGDTLSRLTRDIDLLDHGLTRLTLPVIAALMTTAVFVAWLAANAARFGALIAFAYFGVGLLILLITRRLARRSGASLAIASVAMRASTADWSAGRAELFSLDRAAEFGRQVLDASQALLAAQRRQRRLEAVAQFGLTLVGYLAFWLLLMLALAAHDDGQLAAPLVIAMALAAFALVDLWLPLVPGVGFLETLKRGADRVEHLLEPAAPDDRDIRIDPNQPGRIEIRDLHFRHAPHLPELFGGLNLVIEPGERILIEGPSGCGKSTLLDLIAGILDPQRGEILYDGVSVSALRSDSLRASIGCLTQGSALFADTLAANLRLADPEASDARLRQVLEQVDLGRLVDELPEGLDSWLGEFGHSLSGGQGRRVALARLVLGGFPVVLLDEPAAGLDAATATRIWRGVAPWLAERSLLLCAHDVAVLPPIDRRLVSGIDRQWRIEAVPTDGGDETTC